MRGAGHGDVSSPLPPLPQPTAESVRGVLAPFLARPGGTCRRALDKAVPELWETATEKTSPRTAAGRRVCFAV